MAPVGLALRVLLGIAVDLRGRGEEKPTAVLPREREQVLGAASVDRHDLQAQTPEVQRAGRAGQMENPVHGGQGRGQFLADVGIDERKAGPVGQRGHARAKAGEQIVQAPDLVVVGKQCLTDVGANHAGATDDEHTHC